MTKSRQDYCHILRFVLFQMLYHALNHVGSQEDPVTVGVLFRERLALQSSALAVGERLQEFCAASLVE